MRILLFIATNIAVIALASVTLSLLGVDSFLASNGVDLDLANLLVFCAVFGVMGSLISLFLSKPMARMSTRTRVITQPGDGTERWLLDTVRELADAAGIGMPEVGIFQASQPNAFATGWNRNDSLVAVSTGLLQHMRPEEVRAVLAHEIGHAANGDMVTLALVQGVVNTFVMFIARLVGYFVDRVILKNERGVGIGFFVTTMVMEVVLGILAMMVVMWFSRYREFRADAAGARLAGRENMIAALERLKSGAEMPDAMPATMQAFGINQGLRSGMQALFSSHPPLDVRIAALREAR
jgi:heat shock protein HtpX